MNSLASFNSIHEAQGLQSENQPELREELT